jgi:hypothetical protein
MAKVSISQAAKLAGISRTSLYKTYLNKGVVSISKDSSGKKCIDTAELLRVFGELQGDTVNSNPTQGFEQKLTPETVTQNDLLIEVGQLRFERSNLKEQLSTAREREEWYKHQIDTLTSTLKLLEHKPAPTKPARRWWQFMWK